MIRCKGVKRMVHLRQGKIIGAVCGFGDGIGTRGTVGEGRGEGRRGLSHHNGGGSSGSAFGGGVEGWEGTGVEGRAARSMRRRWMSGADVCLAPPPLSSGVDTDFSGGGVRPDTPSPPLPPPGGGSSNLNRNLAREVVRPRVVLRDPGGAGMDGTGNQPTPVHASEYPI